MACKADQVQLKKKHVPEFWPDVELLNPNFASFVFKYMPVYLTMTEMCWYTLVNILCLKISTINARTGVRGGSKGGLQGLAAPPQ